MGVRNVRRQELRRLEAKTLDARFVTEIQQGMNCSPFEAEAVLKVVKEVYFPFLDQVESPAAVPGTRTISRDLAALRKQEPPVPVPLRSTVHDIGPMLTHRVEIVRLALRGKTMTQICQIMRHSPAAVANYLATFTRVAQLAERHLHSTQIAFLLQRGRGLVERYLELLK